MQFEYGFMYILREYLTRLKSISNVFDSTIKGWKYKIHNPSKGTNEWSCTMIVSHHLIASKQVKHGNATQNTWENDGNTRKGRVSTGGSSSSSSSEWSSWGCQVSRTLSLLRVETLGACFRFERVTTTTSSRPHSLDLDVNWPDQSSYLCMYPY